MPASHPLVSIIIPCYNHGRYLGQSVESALQQTYAAVEVIVIDDGSTDDTPIVAGQYAERIIYCRQTNAGLSAARNTGFSLSHGDLLCFLDADDWFSPDLVEGHVRAAHFHPDASVFCGGCRFVDSEGNLLVEAGPPVIGPDMLLALLQRNQFPCHVAAVRRSALGGIGLFNEDLRASEDWDLWIRLAAAGHKFVPVNGGYAYYRRYPGSMSGDAVRMWKAGREVLRLAESRVPPGDKYRKALTQGRSYWRRFCHGEFMHELRHLVLAGRYKKTIARAAMALRSDWRFLPMMLASGTRFMLKQLRKKLGFAENLPAFSASPR